MSAVFPSFVPSMSSVSAVVDVGTVLVMLGGDGGEVSIELRTVTLLLRL
jgi:hypothetical protein